MPGEFSCSMRTKCKDFKQAGCDPDCKKYKWDEKNSLSQEARSVFRTNVLNELVNRAWVAIDLAMFSGLTLNTVNSLLNGKLLISVKHRVAICEALRMEEELLLTPQLFSSP